MAEALFARPGREKPLPARASFEADADSYISRIRTRFHSLSKSQKKIAMYLAENPEAILSHSITSLSKKIGTTPPSLTRFCQMLQYKGFSDLKFCIERHLASPRTAEHEIAFSDQVDTIRKKLLAMDVKAVTDTMLLADTANVQRAARALGGARAILIYADGNNSVSAAFAYQMLVQIGLACFFQADMRLGKAAASRLKPDTALIGISFSGNSAPVLDIMEDAARLGATTIGLTAFAESRLARMAAIPLCYSSHIVDDFRYLHIARMCEIALLGLVQSALINTVPHQLRENIDLSRKAISSFRTQ